MQTFIHIERSKSLFHYSTFSFYSNPVNKENKISVKYIEYYRNVFECAFMFNVPYIYNVEHCLCSVVWFQYKGDTHGQSYIDAFVIDISTFDTRHLTYFPVIHFSCTPPYTIHFSLFSLSVSLSLACFCVCSLS